MKRPLWFLRTRLRECAATLIVMAVSPLAIAQPADMEEMRRSIDVFAGVLRDSLDLNVRQSIFHPRAGEVSGRYLAGQGITIELGTPLRARRGVMGRFALQQSMSELSGQLDGMRGERRLMVQRPDTDAMREVLALSLRRDQAAVVYREMMEQLAEVDGYAAVDSALRAAGEAARYLRNMGEMSEEVFREQFDDLAVMHAKLAERIAEREALQQSLRESSAERREEPDDTLRDEWQASLDSLQSRMTELREVAVSRADELRARSDTLRADQLTAWRDEVVSFERRLFATLCDYGASLRTLPDGEHLSLILSGLGEDSDNGGRTDRIHVLDKASLLQCQRGDINVEELKLRARSYDM